MNLTLRSLALGAAAVAASSMAACTLLVSTDEVQCNTTDDCHARGPQFANATCVANLCQAASSNESDAGAGDGGAAGPWACLNQAPNAAAPSTQVNVQVVLYNALSPYTFGGKEDGGTDLTLTRYQPQVGVSVAPCTPLDPGCIAPVTPAVLSNDAGVASLSLPGSFTGFYSVQGSGYVPGLFYPGATLPAGQQSVSFPASATSEGSLSALGAELQIDQNTDTDAGAGVVAVVQFDCNDRHVPGVVYTTSPAVAKTIYSQSGFPSPSATQTDVEGSAILVNAPSGSIQISSALVDGGALQSESVFVRPGSLTTVYLRPRAR